MIRLTDGPAACEILMLRRAPLFLRVTLTQDGQWDGLDQLDDHPRPDEEVCVYWRIDEPTVGFVDWADKNGRRRGGQFSSASYRYHIQQPSDEVMRDKARWQQWCRAAADPRGTRPKPPPPTASPPAATVRYGLPDVGGASAPPASGGLFGG